jgi:hypothetical protein
MEVRTEGVSYLLQPNCLGCSPDKEVLDKVNLHLTPGSVTVLMGLGSAHTCLLEVIALRQGGIGRGLMSGKVLHDSQVCVLLYFVLCVLCIIIYYYVYYVLCVLL